METNEQIIQAFTNHGLEIEFSMRGDGLLCTYNGFTISCQWNHFNYCQNRAIKAEPDFFAPSPICADFEMAVWEGGSEKLSRDYISLSDNISLGWVSWECLDEILVAFKAQEWDKMESIALKAVK